MCRVFRLTAVWSRPSVSSKQRRSCVLGLFAARIQSTCVSFGPHELCSGARRCVGVCDCALMWRSYVFHNEVQQLVLAQFAKASSFVPCAGSRRRRLRDTFLGQVNGRVRALGTVRGCTGQCVVEVVRCCCT